MTVVQILPALEQGGVANVARALNRVVVKSGGRSVIISTGGRLVAGIERDGGKHVRLNVKSKNLITYLARARALRKVLTRIIATSDGGVLVCVHSRVPAWLFYRANRKLGLKWITYAHDYNPVPCYSEIMTKGELTIVPSRFQAEWIKKNYAIKEEKIRVVYPAVDFERFDPERLDRGFISKKFREWRIFPGRKVSLTIGCITPDKKLEDVIRDTPNKLIVVGEADVDHQEYFEYLKKCAVGRDVIFAGATDKVPECISLADEVILGEVAKSNAFSFPAVEAYAMNKTVWAKARGGVKEIMDFVNGELLSGQSKDRRTAIRKLCDFDIMYRKTLEIYDSLMHR